VAKISGRLRPQSASAARRGTFRAMFFTSNSGFIGFPVVAALFGEAVHRAL